MSEPERLLREIPSVDLVLRCAEARELLARHSQSFVAEVARGLLGGWREGVRAGRIDAAGLARLAAAPGPELERAVQAALHPRLQRVINATGVVVHTNLGRSPWPARVAERAIAAACRYSNLEYDLARGERGTREAHLDRAAGLFGCEASLVVNNCAAAVLLALNTLAEGRETIVSRGELVEIGGSFRIPEILARSGSILREVGTTNRTRLADYERAIGERSAVLLKVHPSNYRVVGFTEEVGLADLVALGRRHGLPVVEDLGSGGVVDLAPAGVPGEPTVASSLAAGADLVLFSGDKLLGGPQAGIVLGSKALVARLKANPLYRALRPDKVTIAALEELLAIYAAGDPWREVPVLASLALSAGALRPRAERLARALGETAAAARIAEGNSTVGGGSAPLSAVPSPILRLRHPRLGAAELEARLRGGQPAVIVRVEDGEVLIDLRTVAPDEEDALLAALRLALA